MLRTIRSDLDSLVLVCDGTLKQTNAIRGLLSDLTKGTVPQSWRRYRCRELPVAAWIADLSARLEHLTRITDQGVEDHAPTSLGLLFHPHGFITASRQAVAHATKSSLEQLELCIDLDGRNSGFETTGASTFVLEGLALVGATWDLSKLVLNDGSAVRLGPSALSWRHRDSVDINDIRNVQRTVEVPCWLDSTRQDSLFTVRLDAGANTPSVIAQRAVALVAALD